MTVEKIHFNFCKGTLGVHDKATNAAWLWRDANVILQYTRYLVVSRRRHWYKVHSRYLMIITKYSQETLHSWPVRIKSEISRWRHEMETFSTLLALCAGNSPVTDEFPSQRPVTRSFDVFFDLRLNKRLRKQSWRGWFETTSYPLWRHCNISFTWKFQKS